MNRKAMFAALALLGVAAPAVAAQPDNVRVYSILTEAAQLSVDHGAPQAIGPGSVNFYWFATGQHTLDLTTASGATISLNADLQDAQMAVSRGRGWWCITMGRRTKDNVLVLMLDTQAQCMSMLEVAPADHDDPADDDE